VFLDQDLRDRIKVGDGWQERLHERLRWADAVVCVLTSAYVPSTWCAAEVGIAQSRGSRLLPLRAESGVTHPLLKATQQADGVTDPDKARTKLIEALRNLDAAGGSGWPDDQSPFPGLRPFGTSERQAFFGRTREVEQLATLLRSPAERSAATGLPIDAPKRSPPPAHRLVAVTRPRDRRNRSNCMMGGTAPDAHGPLSRCARSSCRGR
jgi:hypothetical protein